MNDEERLLERLQKLNRRVADADPALGLESVAVPEALHGSGGPASRLKARIDEESIILRTKRPVLAIKSNETQLVFREQTDSDLWRARLDAARDFLGPAIRAVGRVEVTGHSNAWLGTGWLVAPDIMVTNRHVALELVERRGDVLSFKPGTSGAPMAASVDFLQEIDNDDTLSFRLLEILDVERKPGPDMAYFRVEVTDGRRLAPHVQLSSRAPESTPNAAVIGYPAKDYRIPDLQLMTNIYGDVYEKKRLAPGAVTAIDGATLRHDCTTLGGNSGSLVLDLGTGQALGLHFSGTFETTNYAVRADIVKQRVDELSSGIRRARAAVPRSFPERDHQLPATTQRTRSTRIDMPPTTKTGSSVTVTIPLTVTVSLGAPAARPRVRVEQPAAATYFDEPEEPDQEARPADYDDRVGYVREFLGDGFEVELPSVAKGKKDVLDFEIDGAKETELRYEHFSVVMSKSRRMCFFSAVNIDGGESKKVKRPGWRIDPRIPKEAQIKDECYGAPPRFSRGHMTRREDPAWGNAAAAKRGGDDSMHVTNATPQMQAFNAPIWLALEDHALQHAREDQMKISVFTGPYFTKNDPVMFGVKIPTSFWKVIAFVHDETGELCATGYEMEQDEQLPAEEFVFGEFVSPQLKRATQVSIASIEARSGLSFGGLADFDPLAQGEESVASGANVLSALEQIRFR